MPDDSAGVAVGDLNSDGNLDLAVANLGAGNVAIFKGIGDGSFDNSPGTRTTSSPSAIAIADLDGNGKPDIAVTNRSANTVSVLSAQNNNFNFSMPATYAVGDTPRGLAAADFNNDGVLDLVSANGGSNNVSILYGRAGGGFDPAVNYPVPAATNTASAPWGVTTAHFNGDALIDIAVAAWGADRVVILLNTSK